MKPITASIRVNRAREDLLAFLGVLAIDFQLDPYPSGSQPRLSGRT
jgi:hypothetical protein